jgi:hypothetical protein
MVFGWLSKASATGLARFRRFIILPGSQAVPASLLVLVDLIVLFRRY